MSLIFPLGPPADSHERDRRIMEWALREAQSAQAEDEVPIGAVVVLGDRIIGRGHNQVEQLRDATAHAEMLALSQAFETVGAKRLVDAQLYCTLEPCLMCAGALLHARVARVVYGARDEKFGGVRSLAQTFQLEGLNHQVEAEGGVLEQAAADLLRSFFRAKRAEKRRE